MARLKVFLFILFLFFCLNVSFGDVIHFKDGRKIEGEVISDDNKNVVIKTKFGTKTFPRSEIEKIEKKKTTRQEYQELLQKTDTKDIDAVMKLVAWCQENKMESEAKKNLKSIIRLDPNNKEAREMLGYVFHEGKWLTPREVQKRKDQKEREEKLAQGLVEYKGEWIPKEDVEKLKAGMVQHEGEWLRPEEVERIKKNLVKYEGQWLPKEDVEKMKEGLYKVGDRWVDKKEANRLHADWEDPWILESEHIKVRTDLDYDYAQKILGEGEDAYKMAKNLVKVEPVLKDSLITLYVSATIEGYNNIGNAIGDEKSSSYPVFFVEDAQEEGNVSISYSIGKKDSDVRYTLGLIRHGVIEQYMRRIDIKGELPFWFIKGEAIKQERFFHDKYIAWSLKAMRGVGGFIKTSQFFDHFGFTEQEIFMSGLVCAYLDSKEVNPKVKEAFQKALESIKTKKKISSQFAALEKALIKDEKGIRAFMAKY